MTDWILKIKKKSSLFAVTKCPVIFRKFKFLPTCCQKRCVHAIFLNSSPLQSFSESLFCLVVRLHCTIFIVVVASFPNWSFLHWKIVSYSYTHSIIRKAWLWSHEFSYFSSLLGDERTRKYFFYTSFSLKFLNLLQNCKTDSLRVAMSCRSWSSSSRVTCAREWTVWNDKNFKFCLLSEDMCSKELVGKLFVIFWRWEKCLIWVKHRREMSQTIN